VLLAALVVAVAFVVFAFRPGRWIVVPLLAAVGIVVIGFVVEGGDDGPVEPIRGPVRGQEAVQAVVASEYLSFPGFNSWPGVFTGTCVETKGVPGRYACLYADGAVRGYTCVGTQRGVNVLYSRFGEVKRYWEDEGGRPLATNELCLPRETATTALTRDELRAMVPSKKELRPLPKNYTTPWFLYVSNRRAPRESTLHNLDPDELTDAGRVGGYEGGLIDGCGGLCSPGLLNLSAEVHVFGTVPQASLFIVDQFVAYTRGERGKYGRLLSVELFDAPKFGKESIALRAEADVGCCDETITQTLILFRVMEVVGISTAVNLNRDRRPGTYPDRRAAALARILERRIEAVLAARQ
jgi:hypothetical protein